MINNKPNGGPAFPADLTAQGGVVTREGNKVIAFPGMTLRDYFAAQVVVGLIAGDPDSTMVNAEYSKYAYEIADIMLAEREK